MGKQARKATWAGSAKGQQDDWAGHSRGQYDAYYWQYWDGAWSPRQKWAKDPGSAIQAIFPAYDDRVLAQRLKHELTGGKGSKDKGAFLRDATDLDSSDPGAALVPGVQDTLNLARKAEQKVRSLTRTRQQKQALWTKYEEDLKMSLMKQYSRHQRDMERLSEELALAMQAQESARAKLRAIALGEEVLEGSPTGPSAEWDQMVTSWKAEQKETEAAEAVLRRALGSHVEREQLTAFRAYLSSVGCSTPPRRGPQVPPMTPPPVGQAPTTTTQHHPAGQQLGQEQSSQSVSPPGLLSDPYQTSPSLNTVRTEAPREQEPAPSAEMSMQSPHRPKAPARVSVKQLPTTVHHPSTPTTTMADKLDARRAQILSQYPAESAEALMAAARAASMGQSLPPGQEAPPQDTGQLSTGQGPLTCTIHDDDTDEEVPMPVEPVAIV